MANDELIRKKDALDALMAERKHLLAKGQKGAEHVLTHHGYNVIDELPPVQSDVPEIYAGELISRQAAIDAVNTALFPKINTAKDAEKALRGLPPVQPKHGHWDCTDDIYENAECSCCKWDSGEAWSYAWANFNFCPNCGADMRGGKDGTD